MDIAARTSQLFAIFESQEIDGLESMVGGLRDAHRLRAARVVASRRPGDHPLRHRSQRETLITRATLTEVTA